MQLAINNNLYLSSAAFKLVLCGFLLSFCLPAMALDPAAFIISTKGIVEIRRSQTADWKIVEKKQTLFAGDAIRTGDNSKVALLMSDETLMQINRNSKLVLQEVAQTSGWQRLRGLVKTAISTAQSIYNLQVGEIWLRNNNRNVNIFINTTVVTAGIRGTEINIKINPDHSVNMIVLEGMIEASNSYGKLIVGTGEEVITVPGGAPRKRLLIQTRDSVQWILTLPQLFTARNFSPLYNGQYASNTQRGWAELEQGDPSKAIDTFNSVSSPDVHTYIGRIVSYADLNQLDEAKKNYQEASIKFTDTPLINIVGAYLDILDYKFTQAQASLQNILSTDTQQPLAWMLLAITSVVLGENDQALQAASNAVGISPDSATAHLILSYVYQAKYNIQGGIASAQNALQLEAENVPALVQLATLQFGSDYLIDAKKTMTRALEVLPTDSDVQQLLGFILLAERNLVDAEQAFQKSLATRPDNADAYLGLSLIHMRQGQVANAMEEITTAVLLDPQRSLLLSYWAKMLYQIKRFDKALLVLNRARQLDPNDPTPEYYRAIILRDLNRPVESIYTLNKAVHLNDNRGVYRSRFLLDRDLAIKNVSLSDLYTRLGLQAWAQKKSVDAIKQDYLNSSAHIFYANTLIGEEDRSYSFISEQLLARLLQPANLNSFNTFNDYTPLFENPGTQGSASVLLGSQRSRDGDLIVFGSVPDKNLAWQAGVFHQETDGWRDTNFEKIDSVAVNSKWEPTTQDGIMFTASHTRLRQGDEQFPRFEIDTPADPIERTNAEVSRLELGYHHHFSPRSDSLLYMALLDIDGLSRDHATFNAPFVVLSAIPILVLPPLTGDTLQDIDFRNRIYQIQFQHMQKMQNHQLIFGTAQYWGNRTATISAETNVLFNGTPFIFPPLLPFNTASRNDLNVRAQSYYMHDIWQFAPSLTLEGAIYYDVMKNASAVLGTDWKISKLNPRLGLIWTPSTKDTFRLALFRYLLPFINARIDPTDIAGIPIFRNTEEGAVNHEVDLVWEHEWSSGLITTNIFYLNKRARDNVISGTREVARIRDGELRGIDIHYNQLIGKIFGLNLRYRWQKIKDDTPTVSERLEHEITVGLNFVKSNGLSGGINQTYRDINFYGGRADEHIPITDLELEYEFPGKGGTVRFEFRNIFDEEFNWITDPFTVIGRVPEREIFGTFTLNF